MSVLMSSEDETESDISSTASNEQEEKALLIVQKA
jgi:hypothetical protein